jgi:hypothetical protein
LPADPQYADSKNIDLRINFKVIGADGKEHITDDIPIVSSNREVKDGRSIWTIGARVPEYSEIFKDTAGQWYEGWLASRKVKLRVSVGSSSPPYIHEVEFGIPRERVALTWGIIVPLGLFVLIALLKPEPFKEDRRFTGGDDRKIAWAKQNVFKRIILYPLSLAVSPRSRYSISIVQILFWTGIVLFASVYVYMVRGDFIKVTEQILVLLGISAGTSLGAKMNAQSGAVGRIDTRYFQGLKRTRLPELRDLISIDDVPNVYKFQMLAFTLINGLIVISQLYSEYNFPAIPAEQLLLIGISNGTYLGNELTGKSRWNNIVEAAKKADEEQDLVKRTAAKDEVRAMMRDYYGAE